MRIPLGLFIFAALGTLPPSLAQADWINWSRGNLPICTASSEQYLAGAVADGAGGSIVVWTDLRTGSSDIYAQHVMADGQVDPAWPADGQAVCTAREAQIAPALVSDGAGGVIVAWHDFRVGGNNDYNIYAQRLSASGAALWTADGVPVCTRADYQISPTIATDGAGGAILAWVDNRAGGASPDIFAQRLSSSGTPQWTPEGVPVCTAVYNQDLPKVTADGVGGAIVVWQDPRAGNVDIYAQRIAGNGTVAWPVNGVPVCTATGDQSAPALTADGAGGAVIAWADARNVLATNVYAQRIGSAGTALWALNGMTICPSVATQNVASVLAADSGGAIFCWTDFRRGFSDIYTQKVAGSGEQQWSSNGTSLCSTTGNKQEASMVSDGAGGAVIAWRDYRGGIPDIVAQRIDALGMTLWSPSGVTLCSDPGYQYTPFLVSDGNSGAVAVWQDYRNGAGADVYAQGVTSLGSLGRSVSPKIAFARDVPNDQGGQLKLAWDASPLDVAAFRAIADYRVWRSVPPNASVVASSLGGPSLSPLAGQPAGQQVFRRTSSAAGVVYWEFVSTHIARQFGGYSTVVSMLGDSLEGSNPRTLFFVEARGTDGVSFWDSPIDSGYSVDNLSPPAPSPFVARYEGTDVALHWLPSLVADFAEFRLYRGGSINFVPGPSNLIFAGRDTGLVDRAGLGGFYKLAAVDVHGNVGRFAMVSPTSPTATLASFVSFDWTGSSASLVWYGAGLTGLRANAYRSDDGTSWNVLGQVAADEEGFVRFSDLTVLPRHRYSYKLGILDEDTEQFAGLTTIEIPGGHLAIRSVIGNPVRGEAIQFVASLAGTSPARARVLDLAGRVVREQNLQAGLSGQLSLSLSGGERLRPGVYLLEVQQAGERAVTRFVYLR